MTRMQYRNGRAVRWRTRLWLALGVAGLLALAACSTTSSTATSMARSTSASRIPAVSGHLLRALWQRPLGGGLVFDGGLILGTSFLAEPADVYAVSATTGSAAWGAKLPGRLLAIGLIPGNGVVIVEAGHQYGRMGAPGVTEYVALDLRTGSRLWTLGAPWHFANPPIAISGNIVLTTDLTGAITARQAMTGRVQWRRPPPSGCWRRGPGPLSNAFVLAADQTQVAASFSCDGYRALVQMLDSATGAMSWSWRPPRSAGAQSSLAATGVASQGDVVLVTGQDAPPDGPDAFASTVPRRYSWPDSLSPADDIQVVLALDARTGQPRWIELGGQGVTFTLADRAVCEAVSAGVECRDDATGAPTGPVLATGQGALPPYGDDAPAGVSGAIAAATIAPFSVGHVSVQVIPIRGERPLGQAEIGTGTSPATPSHATFQPFVVAAGALPSGRTIVLLRRVDLPSDPVIALEVQQ